MATDVHVVPEQEQWAVKCENHAHEEEHYATQREAIDAARRLAEGEHSELVVHGRDGTIREKWSYGSDPRDIEG